MPKTLSEPLYCYVEPDNGKHARTEGKKLFGSFSCYVNALIAKDRGVKPALGFWQAKGEAEKKRLRREKEIARKKAAYLKKKASK